MAPVVINTVIGRVFINDHALAREFLQVSLHKMIQANLSVQPGSHSGVRPNAVQLGKFDAHPLIKSSGTVESSTVSPKSADLSSSAPEPDNLGPDDLPSNADGPDDLPTAASESYDLPTPGPDNLPTPGPDDLPTAAFGSDASQSGIKECITFLTWWSLLVQSGLPDRSQALLTSVAGSSTDKPSNVQCALPVGMPQETELVCQYCDKTLDRTDLSLPWVERFPRCLQCEIEDEEDLIAEHG